MNVLLLLVKPHNLKKKPKRKIMTFSSIAAQTYLSGKTSSTLLRPTLINAHIDQFQRRFYPGTRN